MPGLALKLAPREQVLINGVVVEKPKAPWRFTAFFGYPDDLKFRSCMTLFDAVSPDGIFFDALEKYANGEGDPLTLGLVDTPGK